MPKAAETVALFFSGNMSIGINLLIELSKKADCVIVIGGKHSSNSKKLYDICKLNCKNLRKSAKNNKKVLDLLELL